VILMENTRFEAGEEKNDPELAEAMADSATSIRQRRLFGRAPRPCLDRGRGALLPAYAGTAMEAELEALEKASASRNGRCRHCRRRQGLDQDRPAAEPREKGRHALVIGGGMANTFLAAKGVDVGKSLCEHDLADTAKTIMKPKPKAGCADRPADRRRRRDVSSRRGARQRDRRRLRHPRGRHDPRRRARYGHVKPSTPGSPRPKTLVWNGPLGAFEIEPFDAATVAAAQPRPSGRRPASCLGGRRRRHRRGAQPCRRAEDFTYVSTAGGAFLEWMEGKPLPGVDVLKS
jgi:phosphoglycerate kinase